jgi:hypothetical protein
MARRRRSPYRFGTPSYARDRRTELSRRAILAKGRADRAKSPEARQRSMRQAAAAQRGLRQIPLLEAIGEYRNRLNQPERRIFDSLPLADKARELEVEAKYPDGVPPDVPDPFATSPRHRSASWRLYYATRAGFRHRQAG